MGEYKKITIFLNEKWYGKILKTVEYRNRRINLDNEDKKVSSVEEFVTGSVIQVLKWIESEKSISGLDDLGRPFRLKNKFNELMVERGLTKTDVAKATGINPVNIGKIFSNQNQPSLDFFIRLWIFFDRPSLNEVLYRE